MGRDAKNGWDEYKQLVLHEMTENGKRFEHIEQMMAKLSDDVGTLKIKAAVVGGVAGLVGTGLVSYLTTLFKP